MIIKSLKYIREEGTPNEWAIEGKNEDLIQFDNINLFVGKNAVGKSRSLTALGEIGNILSLKQPISTLKFSNIKYHLRLKENDITYEYEISIKEHLILDEILRVKGVEKYNRKKGKIYSESSKKHEDINLSETELITSIQNNDYSYILEIFEWSNAIKNYAFTNQYEKNHLIKEEDNFTLNNIIKLFEKGKKDFGQLYIDNIISDLYAIGYEVSNIDLLKHKQGLGIGVQEKELSEPTIQLDMSQGMFRALSFIIQLEFALSSKISICLLIDDLGEGLDYDRSKSLIELLVYKVNNSDIQLFITSNDRYIMNKIPLRYWSVIQRKPKASLFYNYHNSRDIFDDFKYTGLNNFDFLASDFYLHGFQNEEEEIQEPE